MSLRIMFLLLGAVIGFILATAERVNADYTFGIPLNLGPAVNSSDHHDDTPSITADGLELYFISYRLRGYPDADLYVSTRKTTQDPWGEAENLGPTINTTGWELGPCISSDGLELYFVSFRPEPSDGGPIWVTKRATRNDDWGPPENLGRFFSGDLFAYSPGISSDGLELYVSEGYISGVGNDQRDLWVISRSSVSDPWGQPMNLGPTVNSPALDTGPSISSDGRMLFFTSDRSGGLGDRDIWVARRASPDDDWGAPVNLGPQVNTPGYEIGPSISADGRTLYFQSGQYRGYTNQEIWQVSIDPVVDLNSDGAVDAADMCIMLDCWGTDARLCDIGPTPLGDGIVDYRDLAVFSENWLKDFRLITHWKLDETGGFIAHDSVGDKNGTVAGAIWQPTSGKINGALAFDGEYDRVSTDFVLNPVGRSFSAFAWIKGGAPGQVIISQTDSSGSAWLCAEPSEGRLMTRLMDVFFPPLESESVITDDQWHHIGLVYNLDVFHRHLYVDGVEVAKDTEIIGGVGSNGGLYIGAGKDLNSDSFFSGLIDDVRIYNQPLSAEEIEELVR
ncbi:MAG: LamG-like jellyroll fold domain-containing protein [Planctomycetota bacterium]